MPATCFLPCLPSRTKIVCTLGPSTDNRDIIKHMIEAGMIVARVNFSHGTREENAQRIEMCRSIAQEMQATIGILADLQGPKLRIGPFASGQVPLAVGQEFTLTPESIRGDKTRVQVPHPEVMEAIEKGARVLLGDGDIELIAVERKGEEVICRVVVGGTLASRKGITVPGVSLRLPVLTEKDEADLRLALEHQVDFVALSFVQEAADVRFLRSRIEALDGEAAIVAKIERRQALKDFDNILVAADAVMVARGDLGLEVPAEEVPIQQKEIIRKARMAGKPVITATQMLESMMHNPRPTRAEASDVANAIMDGTDAVMLSGETAAGNYPVQTVRMMRRIAEVTEESVLYRDWAWQTHPEDSGSVTEAVSEATCEIAHELGAKVIVAATMSGWTAHMVAKHRPHAPIIAVTPDPKVVGKLTLVWGVVPVLVPQYDNTDTMTVEAIEVARERELLDMDDLVVLTAGVPLGGPGRTNMIRIHRAQEIVQSGW